MVRLLRKCLRVGFDALTGDTQGEFLCRSRSWFELCRNQLHVHLLYSRTRSALDAGSGGCSIASSVNRIGQLASRMGASSFKPEDVVSISLSLLVRESSNFSCSLKLLFCCTDESQAKYS